MAHWVAEWWGRQKVSRSLVHRTGSVVNQTTRMWTMKSRVFIYKNYRTSIVHSPVVHRTALQRLYPTTTSDVTASWRGTQSGCALGSVWCLSVEGKSQSDPGLEAHGPGPVVHRTALVPRDSAFFIVKQGATTMWPFWAIKVPLGVLFQNVSATNKCRHFVNHFYLPVSCISLYIVYWHNYKPRYSRGVLLQIGASKILSKRVVLLC